MAASTLIFYEYALTLPMEIRCIWQRRKSITTLLYCTNRYGMLLYQVLMLVHTLSFDFATEAQADQVRALFLTLTLSEEYTLLHRCKHNIRLVVQYPLNNR